MNTNTRIALFALAGLPAGMIGSAMAAESDNSVRLGAYFVHYDAHASDVSGPFVPSGVNLSVDNVNTLYFAYVRRVSPNWSVEIAGGIPPKTNTVGRGPAKLGSVPYDGQTVATAKWFSPTFLAIYNFRDEAETWRPYVGFGANYTHFSDNVSTDAGNAANGGPTKITLSNSFGWAASAGVSYRFNEHWGAYLSYSLSKVKSDMTSDTSGTIRRTTIDFRPSAIVLSAGYTF
jgi:outer membrane protein